MRVGGLNFRKDGPGKTFDVAEIIDGPYKGINAPGDIAFLKLAKPIRFQRGLIEPACLNLVPRRVYKNGLMVRFAVCSLNNGIN